MVGRSKIETPKETSDGSITLRIPKKLKEDIESRAANEGLTTSSWLKKAAEYALENMNVTQERKFSRESLISLLENDPGVGDVLRRKVIESMNVQEIRTILFNYKTAHRYYLDGDNEDLEDLYHLTGDMLTTLPRQQMKNDGRIRFMPRRVKSELTPCGYYVLKWNDETENLADFALQKKYEPADFFCMEKIETNSETGELTRTGMYLWCGAEKPNLRKIAMQAKNAEVRICRGRLSGFERDGRIDWETGERIHPSTKHVLTVCSNVCAALRKAARDYANLGPELDIDDMRCRDFEITMKNRYFSYIPSRVVVQWYSEKLKNREYKSDGELISAIVQKQDATLAPQIRSNFRQEYEADTDGVWVRDETGMPVRFAGMRDVQRHGMMRRIGERKARLEKK